ncbi:MAG: 5'-3' exonuclease H3TH domain-containing protein [Candidatus Limnocylindrales bacterium]
MQLHLVDATYELFRAFYSPRPASFSRDGRDVGAVVGLVYTLLSLLRDEGATHVGCATDHVIRSFRNGLYPGYKTEAGVPAALLAQFPLAERAMAALGLVVWPMVDYEADDALATAASRWAEVRGVDRVVICTPDKDLAQCVRGERVIMRDRRRDRTVDEAGVVARWGVRPASIPDYLALVGDSADGFPGLPGWGERSAAAVLGRFEHLESIPTHVGEWHVDVRSPATLNATLRARWPDALLFRRLATLASDAPLPQGDPEELLWQGARRAEFTALCDELGQPRLAERPHLWQD